jgi:hypothetical protein
MTLSFGQPQRLPISVSPSTDSFQQRNEARLFEEVVGGERITNTQLAHSAEADAVGERPLPVRVFAEQGAGGVKELRADPFQPCLFRFVFDLHVWYAALRQGPYDDRFQKPDCREA